MKERSCQKAKFRMIKLHNKYLKTWSHLKVLVSLNLSVTNSSSKNLEDVCWTIKLKSIIVFIISNSKTDRWGCSCLGILAAQNWRKWQIKIHHACKENFHNKHPFIPWNCWPKGKVNVRSACFGVESFGRN